MKKHGAVKYAVIVLLVVLFSTVALTGFRVGIYKVNPLFTLLERGLDLRGGMEMVYDAEPLSQDADADIVMAGTMQKLLARLQAYGYDEATVSRAGASQIRVEIPLLDDAQEVLDALSDSGKLTFRLGKDVIMTGEHVEYAMAGRLKDSNQPAVSFSLDEEGKQIFADVTAAHVGEIMAIYLDEEKIAEPQISAPVTDGLISISQIGTLEEATQLAGMISSGELNAALTLSSQRNIQSELSQQARTYLIAALIAACAVVCSYFVVRYRLCGLMAATSFLLHAIFVLFLILTVKGTKFSMSSILAVCLAQAVALYQFDTLLQRVNARVSSQRALLVEFKQAQKDTLRTQMVLDVFLIAAGLAAQLSDTPSFATFGRILAFAGIACGVCVMLIFPGFAAMAASMSKQNAVRFGGSVKEEKAAKALTFEKGSALLRRARFVLPAAFFLLGVLACLLWADTSRLMVNNALLALAAAAITLCAVGLGAIAFGKKERALGGMLDALTAMLFVASITCAFTGLLRADMLAPIFGATVFCCVCLLGQMGAFAQSAAYKAIGFAALCTVFALFCGAPSMRVYAASILACAIAAIAQSLCACAQMQEKKRTTRKS